MNSRIITDPENWTHEKLQDPNVDWDIVRTNITVDVDQLMEWYTTIEEKYSDCAFIIPGHILLYGNEQVRTKEFLEQVKQKNTYGTTFQWTLQWSYDRDGVIPFIQLADPVQFPEVHGIEFEKETTFNLPKYMFGIYEKYYNTFGPECFRITRLVKFHKNSGLRPHVDYKGSYRFIRMHLQLQSTEGSKLTFGENADRPAPELEPGRVYLLNTTEYHEAVNRSRTPWIFVHNNPEPTSVDKILKSAIHIE